MNFVNRSEKKQNEDAITIAKTLKHEISNQIVSPQDVLTCRLDDQANLWIVADGASGLTKADHMHIASDAAWFSHFLCWYLAVHNDVTKTLSALLEEACLCAKRQFEDCPELEKPSCAIAILRKNETLHCFDYLLLGDCVLFFQLKDPQSAEISYLKVTDDRIAEFDQRAIDEMARLAKQKNESMIAQRPFVQSILIHNRNQKNKPGGYAIADLSNDWLHQEITGCIRFDQFEHAALYSDGFDQLQSFLSLDNHQFGQYLFSHNAQDQVDLLFVYQDADPNCIQLPRLKKRDDTSLILI